MAGLGGKREGAGRKPGVPNKVTLKREAELSQGGMMPLDYMLGVLRNALEPEERRAWAAEKAAPYCHPRLATVQHEGNGPNGEIVHMIERRIVKNPTD